MTVSFRAKLGNEAPGRSAVWLTAGQVALIAGEASEPIPDGHSATAKVLFSRSVASANADVTEAQLTPGQVDFTSADNTDDSVLDYVIIG